MALSPKFTSENAQSKQNSQKFSNNVRMNKITLYHTVTTKSTILPDFAYNTTVVVNNLIVKIS